jgi:hypothetical protein
MYLQRSCDKHSSVAFDFSIVEECDTADLLMREKFYIDQDNPSFNIYSDPAAPMKGRKHTERSRAKISAGCTGLTREVTDETCALLRNANIKAGNNKPVVAKDPASGEIRHRFETIGDAAKLGWKNSAVIRCCKGVMPSYQGLLGSMRIAKI